MIIKKKNQLNTKSHQKWKGRGGPSYIVFFTELRETLIELKFLSQLIKSYLILYTSTIKKSVSHLDSSRMISEYIERIGMKSSQGYRGLYKN